MHANQTHFIEAKVQEYVEKSSFVEAKELKLFIGSWNVNATIEDISNLDMWIPPVDHSTGQKFDLIVIGLQEMIELSATNVVGSAVASVSDEKAAKWEALLLQYLLVASCCADVTGDSSAANKGGIKLVAACHLVGIWVGVFAREYLIPNISNVEIANVACGAGGVLGNKGASCVRMDVFDTSLCFACAHLSAHQNAVSKRNEDFHTIMSKGVFMDDTIASVMEWKEECLQTTSATRVKTQLEAIRKRVIKFDPAVIGDIQTASAELNQKKQIGEHDIVFFFGDLNYRINENSRTLDDIYSLMHEDLELLKVDDQLNIERRCGRVLGDFSEGSLTFLPTYKFIAGTDEYDRRPEKKLRVPAWCDRILWRVGKVKDKLPKITPPNSTDGNSPQESDSTLQDGLSPLQNSKGTAEGDTKEGCVEWVQQLRYQRCDNTISDHRPIRSSFNIAVKSIYKERKEAIYADIFNQSCLQDTSRMAAAVPHVYMRIAGSGNLSTTVNLRNLSTKSTSQYRINAQSLPSWLCAEPMSANVEPAGQISLSLTFLPDLARELLEGVVEQSRYELNAVVDLGTLDQLGCKLNIPVSVLATL